MRNHGTRTELVRLRPHDHIGWVFSGRAHFAAIAKPFLEEGEALGERLMFVADNPEHEAYVAAMSGFDPQGFEVASISDVYGASGIVDAARQRAVFAEAMAEALSRGYSGIRVAADNSSLVSKPERLKAWIEWELVADRFMAENHVTGLCAFNRETVAVDTLRHLATLHPLVSADEPAPQFSMFVEEGRLVIEGEVDEFALDNVELALRHLPAGTRVTVDMAHATVRGEKVRAHLRALASTEPLLDLDDWLLGLGDEDLVREA